ncbi:hypothetical protein [Thauera humireducens]|uniref:hypothetical protein n=1 Tax=Thauera humireducens TaxID=1134435 RepID=UPI00311F82BB
MIRLLLDAEALHCRFDRIWFNGRDQLNAVPDPAGEPLGALQGEILGVLIADYEARTGSAVWNLGFDQALAAIDRRQPTLPTVDLPGDCRLTLLSPDHERLLHLKDRWKKELDRAGIASGDVAALRTRLAASRSLRPLGDVLGAEDKADEVEAMSGRHELPEDDDRDLGAELEDTLGRGSGELVQTPPSAATPARPMAAASPCCSNTPRPRPKCACCWPAMPGRACSRPRSPPCSAIRQNASRWTPSSCPITAASPTSAPACSTACAAAITWCRPAARCSATRTTRARSDPRAPCRSGTSHAALQLPHALHRPVERHRRPGTPQLPRPPPEGPCRFILNPSDAAPPTPESTPCPRKPCR